MDAVRRGGRDELGVIDGVVELGAERHQTGSGGGHQIDGIEVADTRRWSPCQAICARPDGGRAVVVGRGAPRDQSGAPRGHAIELGLNDVCGLRELLPRPTGSRFKDHQACVRVLSAFVIEDVRARFELAEEIDVVAHRDDVSGRKSWCPKGRWTASTSAPTPACRRCSSAPPPRRCWCGTGRRWRATGLIRSRWGRWIAQLLPVIGLTMLGVVAHFATGSAPEFRRGLLIVVAVAAVFVVAPVALEQRGLVARVLAWPPLVWLGVISYGVYLWHWPIFLALNGEHTGLTGMPLFAIRALGDGDAGRDFVVADRAADPALAARARSAAAARGGDAGDGGGRDDGRGAGRRQAPGEIRQGPDVLPPPSSRKCRSRSAGRHGGSGYPHRRRLRGLDGLDDDALPAADAGLQVHRLHHHRLRHRPRRAVPVDRGDAHSEARMRDMATRWAQRISHAKPDVVLLIIGRWETVDRVNEGHWTHVGDPASTGTSRANCAARSTSSGRPAPAWS